jgi:lysophospholipase L1-like esterase
MRLLVTFLSVIWLTATVNGAILAGDKNIGSIWCIGDSIMQSVADGNANSSPRLSLYNQLYANGYRFNYTGSWDANIDGLPSTGSTPETNYFQYHDGHSGWQINSFTQSGTGNVANLWNTGRIASIKPNVIIIMLGTNDINNYNAYATTTPDVAAGVARDRMVTLLNNIYALPNVGNPTIILSTIPPNKTSSNGGTPEQHMEAVMDYNSLLSGVVSDFQADGKSIYLADPFTLLNNEYALSMQSDNLHANTYGNDLLAQAWFNTIDGIIAIPELSTYAMLGFGLVGVALTAKFGRIRKTFK